jgi:hypothetical protein
LQRTGSDRSRIAFTSAGFPRLPVAEEAPRLVGSGAFSTVKALLELDLAEFGMNDPLEAQAKAVDIVLRPSAVEFRARCVGPRDQLMEGLIVAAATEIEAEPGNGGTASVTRRDGGVCRAFMAIIDTGATPHCATLHAGYHGFAAGPQRPGAWPVNKSSALTPR